MKKILFLLALVISAVFTTCESSNNSGTGDGETYTITFDANGGEGGQPASVTATYGQPMPAITEAPTWSDYDFTGYFDAQTGGKKYYNKNLSSARNWDKKEASVLYAQWTSISAESSIVSIVQAPSTITQASQFTQESVTALVREAVRLAGGLEGIVKFGDTVVLKPNVINAKTTWAEAGQGTGIAELVNGVCTDRRVVRAAAILVREIVGAKGTAGAGKILIIEGSGKGSTAEHFGVIGYTAANLPEVDEIIALDNEGTWTDSQNSSANVKVTLDGFVYKTAPTSGTYSGKYLNDGGYYVNKKMYDADVLICLPVVKNHWNAVVTGAIKNISIGAAPPRVYGISGTDVGRNNMVDHNTIGFHQWIADYYACLPADFVIMDGLQGLENGPLPGTMPGIPASQKNMRTILASRDALAIDVVETNIINWDYTTVKYLQYLTDRGQVGVAPKAIKTVRGDPRNITVLGNVKVDDIRTEFNGNLPAAGGSKLTTAQLTQPSVNITSAAFTGQDLNLQLNLSANVVKVDIYIDGEYVKSFNGNLTDITFDTAGISGGSKSITVQAFSRYMRQNTASTTASK